MKVCTDSVSTNSRLADNAQHYLLEHARALAPNSARDFSSRICAEFYATTAFDAAGSFELATTKFSPGFKSDICTF
jgi:hypothetical protein